MGGEQAVCVMCVYVLFLNYFIDFISLFADVARVLQDSFLCSCLSKTEKEIQPNKHPRGLAAADLLLRGSLRKTSKSTVTMTLEQEKPTLSGDHRKGRR